MRKVGEQAIVEHLDSPMKRHVLSPTASRIWELIERGESPDRIVDSLSESYGVDAATIRDDVSRFVRFALSRSLLHADTGAIAWLGVADEAGSVAATGSSPKLYAALIADAERTRVLYKASLELTYGCNLRCIQCYAEGGREQSAALPPPLSTARWLRLIGELRTLGCLQITITGGEPFTHRDVLRILRRVDEVGCAVRIQTNGLLLRPKVVDALQKLTRLEALEVSVFGATAETYERVTRLPGAFPRLMETLTRLAASGLPVCAKFVTMRQNFHDVDRFVELTESLGLRRVVGHGQIYPSTLGTLSNTDKLVAPAQMLQLFRKNLVAPSTPTDDRCWLCRAGLIRANVTPGGDLWPCERLPYSFGNVRESSLESVWQSDEADRFRSLVAEPHAVCASCDKKPFCSHCWAMPWLYERREVAAAVADMRGYSPYSCRIAEVYRAAAEESGTGPAQPTLASQVF
jgi:radical SAM protein with 4Fe4S-binding SPASM domain